MLVILPTTDLQMKLIKFGPKLSCGIVDPGSAEKWNDYFRLCHLIQTKLQNYIYSFLEISLTNFEIRIVFADCDNFE